MNLKLIVKKYLGIDEPKICDMQIGTQNKTYIINDKYVMKVYNKDTINSEADRLKREKKDIIAIEAKKNNINAITPINIEEKYIHKEGNIYFSFYSYVTYKSLEPKDINGEKVINLTKQIKLIHKTNFISLLEDKPKEKQILNLDKYLIIYKKTNKELFDIIIKNRVMLEKLANFINAAIGNLKSKNVISHNDLKPANILWNKNEPFLLDWDACGYRNPSCAFNEYAYFLSFENGVLNKEKFKLFISMYYIDNKLIDDIDSVLYATLYGKMSWFIYSLERSIYTNQDECYEGENCIKELIQSFNNYLKNYNELKEIYKRICIK